MSKKITISQGKGKSQFDVAKFNARAKIAFETVVKPQIEKAKKVELP